MPEEITGIILAGGKSSRMGQDKSMMMFHGRPLILNAINIIQDFCDRVVISSDNPAHGFTGCEIWPDEFPVQAPMSGICTCIRRSFTAWNIILSCDMPLVEPALFRHLIGECGDYDVVIPVHRLGLEPLCGLYNRSAVPLLESSMAIGQYSMQRLIHSANHKLIRIEPELDYYREDMFVNINTWEDYTLLSRD
jgi:molybdopterin-guanine dinucleotide biosynthesis protein A